MYTSEAADFSRTANGFRIRRHKMNDTREATHVKRVMVFYGVKLNNIPL